MSKLIAFRFADTVIVAAESAEQALGIMHASKDYKDFRLEEGRPCTEQEMDAPQTCTSHLPAPTLRQRLEHVDQPGFLQDWDAYCPPMPVSVWAELEKDD